MQLSLTIRKWHKWLSLVIGVQFFLWTASGFFMSYAPLNEVKSENIIKKIEVEALKVNNLVSIASFNFSPENGNLKVVRNNIW